MARLFGIHEVELRPEVDPAEFERVFTEEIASSAALPGLKPRLLKGERGVRAGKYLVLLEMEDAELLYRYFPQPGQPSEEFESFFEQHPDTAAAWGKLDSLAAEEDVVTDYVVVVE